MNLPAVSSPVYPTGIQDDNMPPTKKTFKPELVRHTEASKEALDLLMELLGNRYSKSDIIRDAIIEKAEREKKKLRNK
jgi:hypothetical protein